jgi:hypothetical protein
MLDHIPLWKSKYAIKLSILDHINELTIIDTEIKRRKNCLEASLQDAKIPELENHFDKEAADLWLLLSTYLGVGDLYTELPALLEQRLIKFEAKQKEDC